MLLKKCWIFEDKNISSRIKLPETGYNYCRGCKFYNPKTTLTSICFAPVNVDKMCMKLRNTVLGDTWREVRKISTA